MITPEAGDGIDHQKRVMAGGVDGLAELLARVEQGGIDEVVLAMNATLEGQTTAHYIADQLEGQVRLSSLAQGVPIGGELDYLDDGTITAAMRARKSL